MSRKNGFDVSLELVQKVFSTSELIYLDVSMYISSRSDEMIYQMNFGFWFKLELHVFE